MEILLVIIGLIVAVKVLRSNEGRMVKDATKAELFKILDLDETKVKQNREFLQSLESAMNELESKSKG